MRGRQRISPAAKVLVGAGLVWALLAPPVAAAGPPQSGSGTGLITGAEIAVIRVVGGNSHEARTLTGTVDGDLTGTFVQQVTGTVHTNHPENRVTFRGTLEFTGTVAGCGDEVHTLTLGVTGNGTVPVAGFPITEATVRGIKQPASTLAITGVGTVSQEGPNLSYELRYVCR